MHDITQEDKNAQRQRKNIHYKFIVQLVKKREQICTLEGNFSLLVLPLQIGDIPGQNTCK
jgi:hypothetical protein